MVTTSLDSDAARAGGLSVTVRPAFIRYPKPPHRDPVCGLSRTQLHSLIKAGRVRSVSLKQPGKGRGVRLIEVESLIAAVRNEAAGQSGGPPDSNTRRTIAD